jgi:ERF superfamily
VQRSSESIGAIAAALAKAQAELVNPEKSLIGTIRTDNPDGAERVFRYAPLSGGLDIVREVLGQHEIATVQTTAMDQAAGMITLTTMLAHASGEWIASDWPVCAISDTVTPHRMGAALTYARRYALFTLVGIAGEDDLDAPDLVTPTDRSSNAERPKGANGNATGGPAHTHAKAHGSRNSRVTGPPLAPEASASLRDQLVGQIAGLETGEDAARWAKRQLAEKNRLTGADAEQVETAFQAKLANLPTGVEDQLPAGMSLAAAANDGTRRGAKSRRRSVDKSALTFPEPRRIRDRDHIIYVARQACLVCGRRPTDAHHLRFAQSPALGRKVSDEFTVPLCRGHHREAHHASDEALWWRNARIDPVASARRLWLQTHPLPKGSDGTGVAEPRPLDISKIDRPVGQPSLNDETNLIIPASRP